MNFEDKFSFIVIFVIILFRHIRECPLQGGCLSKNIKFKIKVENNNQIKTFYGSCINSTFKSRFYHIKHMMKNGNMQYKNPFARLVIFKYF